jgi:uncharacterized membrane protein
MVAQIGILILITMLPVFELRGSIPLGIWAFGLSPWVVIPICLISNIAVSPLVYFLLDWMIRLVCKIKFMDFLYQKYRTKVIDKVKVKMEKYGVWGLAVFIGIPLPGSGVYSGAVGAHALGISFKKYMIAAVVGVLIAGTAVSIIVITGAEGWDIFIKAINKSPT